MKEVREDFKRKELFDWYGTKTNPFIIVTTKLDITNIYNLGKKYQCCYGSIGYFLVRALNRVNEFKYQYKEGKIIKYDIVHPNYTQMLDDGTIGFFDVPLTDDYETFIEDFKRIEKDFKESKKSIVNDEIGSIWLSCIPWFHFSGLIPPFDGNVGIPQLIWDKFDFIDGRCYVNLMIMAHHGFVDGFHIGKLINEMEKEIASIEG